MPDELAGLADDAELARIRRIIHSLTCRDRLTAQLAAQALEAFGIERTATEIERDLQLSSCEICAAQAAQPEPEPDPGPVRAVVHRSTASGLLTGSWPFDG